MIRTEIDRSATLSEQSLKAVTSVAITSRYQFHGLSLLGAEYILAAPTTPFTISRLVVDFAAIEAKTGKTVIALFTELSPYFRRRLVAERIPFLLTDKQAFLPFVYLNLTASKPIKQPSDFTPTTQAVFLALLFSEGEPRTQGDLSDQLCLSAMSVSRSIEQLLRHGLISVTTAGKTGRRKIIDVPDLSEFYRAGIRHFGNPVKRTLYATGDLPTGLPRSGLDALATRTMLAPSGRPWFTAFHRRRSEFIENPIDWFEANDRDDSFRIDLLTYDPSVFSIDGLVDPVTMLLSVDEHDERIDQALTDHMKGYPWYSE